MKVIPLNRGLVTYVDDDDYEALAAHKWRALRGSSPNSPWYACGRRRGEDGKRRHLAMHRLLTNARDGEIVDHINRNSLDNRRSNLRITTPSGNHLNTGKLATNTSGFKGVTWQSSCNKWQAQITVRGQTFYLGVFVSPEDAARAYDTKALELDPIHCVVNFGGVR